MFKMNGKFRVIVRKLTLRFPKSSVHVNCNVWMHCSEAQLAGRMGKGPHDGPMEGCTDKIASARWWVYGEGGKGQ